MWFWNWGNFEIISWIFKIILKWFINFAQLSSNDHNFFVSTSICVHRLKCWTFDFLSFKMIYSLPKIDLGSALDLTSKSEYVLLPGFEFQISMWTWLHLLQPSSILVACALSQSIISVASISCLWLAHYALVWTLHSSQVPSLSIMHV